MSREAVRTSKLISQRLGFRLRRATFSLRRLFSSRIAVSDVTPEQYLVLVHLADRPAKSQRELAERSCTNPNTVKSILNHLESKGWARRDPSGRDGRTNVVKITPAGDRVRRNLMKIADEVTATALQRLSVNQQQVLLAALDLVAQSANEAIDAASNQEVRV